MRCVTHFIRYCYQAKPLSVACFLVGVLSVGSPAANAGDSPFLEMTLQELLQIEVEVSNRMPTALVNSPASITVFSREDLQRLGIRSLDKLLNYVPGFSISRTDVEGRSNAPSVRGRRSNSAGRELLVLLDGIRLNDPVTGGVFSQERDLNLFNVKQVEIVRGPGSALYGANAFSGVVNIVTDTEESIAELMQGNFDASEGLIKLSHGGDKWGVSTMISHYKDNGDHYERFYDFFGVNEESQDPERQSDIYLKAYIDATTLVFRRNERSNAEFVVAGGQGSERQRHRVENRSMRLSHEIALDQLHMNWFAEYSENEADSLFALFPEDPNPVPVGNPFYWSDGSTVEMLGGNIRKVEQERFGGDFRYDLTPNHALNFGALYRKESVGLNPFQSNIDVETVRTTGDIVPTPQDDFIQEGFYIAGERFDLLEKSSRESVGLYIQDAWRVDHTLTLTSGVRYDHYQDFGSNYSFRIGAVKKWNEARTFKLLYGDAFRAPSFLETRAGIATGGISNPDLNPEKVRTYEFSWTENHNEVNSILTLFHNQYEDLVIPVLVSDVVPGFTAFQPQNKADERTNGVEWELSGEFANGLRLRSGLSHVFNAVDDEPIGDTTFFVIGDLNVGKASLNVRTYFHDDVQSRAHSSDTLDSYWVSDVSVRYELSPESGIKLLVNNLFDTSYRTWSPQDGLEDGLPSRGRQFMLGFYVSGF